MRPDAAVVDPQRLVAEALDQTERVRHEQDCLPAAPELGELVEALVGESLVADREHLVHEQHVGIDVNRHGEPEPHVHAGRVRLHRRVDELAQLGELDDLVEALLDLALGQPEHDAVDEHVLAAGDFRVKAGAELDERRDAALDRDGAARRLRDAGHQLQCGALAGAVAADDAVGGSLRHLNDTSVSAGNVSLGCRSRRMLRCSSALLSVAN